jgi:hypothetical protein
MRGGGFLLSGLEHGVVLKFVFVYVRFLRDFYFITYPAGMIDNKCGIDQSTNQLIIVNLVGPPSPNRRNPPQWATNCQGSAVVLIFLFSDSPVYQCR